MDRVIGNALSTLDEMEATIAVAREKLHVLNYIMYSDPTLRDLKDLKVMIDNFNIVESLGSSTNDLSDCQEEMAEIVDKMYDSAKERKRLRDVKEIVTPFLFERIREPGLVRKILQTM